MKNQEAFTNCEKYKTVNLKKTITAYEINKQMFDKILYDIKTDFEIFNGPKVIFQKDEVFDKTPIIGIQWIQSNLEINYDKINRILYIKSPVLYTGLNFIEKYRGMYYMKILSPQLCYELIQQYF